jgi:uncharacterized circularly permuted ATP-grasp superfamily protein
MTNPIQQWDDVLRGEDVSALCGHLADEMRGRRLTFGGRLLCPFLRPFFIDAADEARVKEAVETLWTLGERIASTAIGMPALLDGLALNDEEIRLARIDPGYATASTAARADAFLLPDTLQFAEYNAESPAGLGYSQGLAEIFSDTPVMSRFRERLDAELYRPVERILDALMASYREWGGTASPPTVAIVDWRDVPTFTEFEILRDAFVRLGVPTIISDPRDLTFESAGARPGLHAAGARIDCVYRRVLVNDIVARPDECRALIAAYEKRAVCVANSLRCKIPHKKAFFAVLTDERWWKLFSARERILIRRHVPWTALVRDGKVHRDECDIDLIPHIRRERERLVLKPNDDYGGHGVTLGWETSESDWDAAIARAIAERERGWVVQERIAIRREPFPMCVDGHIETRDMLVDFAPYVFRGQVAGFLTRLSATGLANVTSGGGQVPAFVVRNRVS